MGVNYRQLAGIILKNFLLSSYSGVDSVESVVLKENVLKVLELTEKIKFDIESQKIIVKRA